MDHPEMSNGQRGITSYPFRGYTMHYHPAFSDRRHRPIIMLEIGLARNRDRHDPRVRCPSLEIWAEYFPQAIIAGFDVDGFSMVQQQRTRIFRGDHGNERDVLELTAVFRELGVIIDAGTYASVHQQEVLKILWPFLAPGAVYSVEDLDEQPTALEASLPALSKKTRTY